MLMTTRVHPQSTNSKKNIKELKYFTVRISFTADKQSFQRAVVVAQLVERSLLTPEVCSSNPVIGTINIEYCLLSSV